MNILLLYPTPYRVTGLPVGLATISAVLKENGNNVKIFDTAFYPSENEKNQNELRAKLMMTKKIAGEKTVFIDNDTKMEKDLLSLLKEFQPSLVGISILEPTYHIALSMTRLVKKHFPGMLIIAGGVFPTLSPELPFKEESIDGVCVGEGEIMMVKLVERFSKGEDISSLNGLWLKKDGREIRNPPMELQELETLPHPDYEVFDERLLLKPMQGRFYKMVNIESSRGCPYTCTYCGAPKLKKFYRTANSGNYFRNMSIHRVMDQIRYQVAKHKPEFIYFSSESFLSMNDNDFRVFVREYSEIKLPFWFQTRVETITEERIAELKQAGLLWMTIGLEHGNEEFRKKILKRHYSNGKIIDAVRILRKLDLGASINNIIGFPFETRELVFDTIKINKTLFEINNKIESNIFMFTPYNGCELYDICREEKLISDSSFLDADPVDDESCLNFRKEWKDELKGLFRTFNLYVKLPEKYYDEIKIAEKFNSAGDKKLDELTLMVRNNH